MILIFSQCQIKCTDGLPDIIPHKTFITSLIHLPEIIHLNRSTSYFICLLFIIDTFSSFSMALFYFKMMSIIASNPPHIFSEISMP